MKKSDRIKIFEKYGGKCAYCGCDLTKSWHADHIKPIVRDSKFDRKRVSLWIVEHVGIQKMKF